MNEGEKVRVRGVWDGEAEARMVGDEIESLQNKGQKLNQVAILVRAGFQTREFEERLITIGIPYRVIGGPPILRTPGNSGRRRLFTCGRAAR